MTMNEFLLLADGVEFESLASRFDLLDLHDVIIEFGQRFPEMGRSGGGRIFAMNHINTLFPGHNLSKEP